VIALTIRIGDETGSVTSSGRYEIQPNGYIDQEEGFSAYADFCEGIRKHPIAISYVDFSDGSEWQAEPNHNP
jgi:hypothetical protein